MKKLMLLFGSVLVFLAVQAGNSNGTIANPLNLNYRFQSDEPSRREAADPVIEYFKGKYYLFASKSGGYWSSPDMAEWTYIPCKTISTIESYAPTVLAHGDTLYYLASGSTRICYTTNPDLDSWKALSPSQFSISETDPAFFKDDATGKVYVYWGCSDKDPIKGIEVDPKKAFKSVGTPVALIDHHTDRYGWEIPGNSNNEDRTGWNEGPTMLKYHGKYYLQYASPGTEYRIYADGVYVSDSPLGPFTYMKNSPFSIKPGGYIGGAGHGHTFKDKYGNYWHTATMRISKRHSFERRLGLFPVFFNEEGEMNARTVWSDYPFSIPNEPVDFSTNDCSMNWNLLSYHKAVSASSTLSGYAPENANNEEIENWWSAQTGDAGEWWKIDLGRTMAVNALQINFADMDFTNKAVNSYTFYQYYVEASTDGENWTTIVDRRQNTADAPHELVVLDLVQQARYLRITNTKTLEGKFSLSGFRVFGQGGGEPPLAVSGLQVKRKTDKRRFLLEWAKQENVTGYVVRWGVAANRLNNAVMVFDNQLEAGYFNSDTEYFFAVDAFNENGVTPATEVLKGNVFYGTAYQGVAREVPGTIEAEDYNEGGQNFAYYDASAGNSNLLYRAKEDVDIDFYRRYSAYFIANTETGEYANYTIDVKEPGSYDLQVVGASVTAGSEGGFYMDFDGEKAKLPAVIQFPVGSRGSFHPVEMNNLSFSQGIHVMTLNIQGDVYVDKFIFKKTETGLDNQASRPLTAYPNPSSQIFHLSLPQSGVVSIANVYGKTLHSSFESEPSVDLDASSYPPGVYFLSFSSDNLRMTMKLIKK